MSFPAVLWQPFLWICAVLQSPVTLHAKTHGEVRSAQANFFKLYSLRGGYSREHILNHKCLQVCITSCLSQDLLVKGGETPSCDQSNVQVGALQQASHFGVAVASCGRLPGHYRLSPPHDQDFLRALLRFSEGHISAD